ncbi:MAG: 16S rRNA (guanine(966)-N(2))-methyltransferase RsmD [Bacteroidetes bacterium]|nr:MAG: 16S rRNA (guanine(966)-N(2))-methyltransferase RsmD [Bacteroidota bacterium]
MRIVGGTHRSRQFNIPEKLGIRPTTDFAKEALFNILQHSVELEGIKVLDLFGGSGSISYEFASRGAAEITCIEKNPQSMSFIKKTALEFKFPNIKVTCMDVFKYLSLCSETFDIIFADPPFKLENIERIPALIFEKKLLKENGILIVEHPSDVKFTGIMQLQETREYGTVNFSIFGNNRFYR